MITDTREISKRLQEILHDWWDTTDIQKAHVMDEYEHEAAETFIEKIRRNQPMTEKQLRYANRLIAKYETYQGAEYRPSDIGRFNKDA
jgi:hypothetical protein